MSFLRHNKKGLNTGTFSESDYSVLDYEQLLAVNGAGGSGGGGGPSGPTGPSSSHGGTNKTTPSSGGTTSKGGSKYVENSNSGVANAHVGDKIIRNDGTEVTLTQGDIDWAKSKVNGGSSVPAPSTPKPTNPASPQKPVQTPNPKSTAYGKNSVTSKVESAIDKVGKKNYVKGSYMCDDYVEDVIKNAGYNPKDYCVDNPSGKTVDQHIRDLTSSGKNNYSTNASKLTEGTYVVFMSDNQKVKDSHASILVIDSNGNAYMQDNSSHNNATKWNSSGKPVEWAGGTEKYGGHGYSAKNVCDVYTGYENFYFQKLK